MINSVEYWNRDSEEKKHVSHEAPRAIYIQS
jgi:hypothetical protein